MVIVCVSVCMFFEKKTIKTFKIFSICSLLAIFFWKNVVELQVVSCMKWAVNFNIKIVIDCVNMSFFFYTDKDRNKTLKMYQNGEEKKNKELVQSMWVSKSQVKEKNVTLLRQILKKLQVWKLISFWVPIKSLVPLFRTYLSLVWVIMSLYQLLRPFDVSNSCIIATLV